MKSVFKRMFMFVLSLLMIATTVGCNASKKNWGKLSQEEKIDTVLQSFERMKNGEIHIVNTMNAEKVSPKEGESPIWKYELEFTGTFELRPDHIVGKYLFDGKVSDYYCDRMCVYEKKETEAQWTTRRVDIVHYKQPMGIHQDAILYLQTIKDQLRLSEEDDTVTVHYEADDLEFLDANSDRLTGSTLNIYSFAKGDKSGKLTIDLTISKDDCTPVSVTITGQGNNDYYKNRDFVSKTTFSKVNSGIHVDVPSGIENPIYD